MPLMIDNVFGAASKRRTRAATIVAITPVGAAHVRIDVHLDGKVPRWEPGLKVQFHLGGSAYRTYTPFDWDGPAASFLVHRGGHGPAGDWFDTRSVGDSLGVLGPRRALRLDLPDTPILVGDETSFGLAAACRRLDVGPPTAQIFEVTSAADAAVVIDHLGLEPAPAPQYDDPFAPARPTSDGDDPLVVDLTDHDDVFIDLTTDRTDLAFDRVHHAGQVALDPVTVVERVADDDHHEVLTAAVVHAVEHRPDAPLLLTGRAHTIREVRRALKLAGLSPTTRAKAHWADNRTALD